MGAILVDDDTVRVIVQSESYGPVTRYESYPWYVNGKSASFTGSHVQYIDYDRTKLAAFHDEGAPETIEDAVKGSGELIKRAYNLKGELIGPRNTTLEVRAFELRSDKPRKGVRGAFTSCTYTFIRMCSTAISDAYF